MCYLFTAQSQVHILFNFKVYYILNKSLLESLNFYLEIFCGLCYTKILKEMQISPEYKKCFSDV